MDKNQITALILLVSAYLLPISIDAQDEKSTDISYQVLKANPTLSISPDELVEANSLQDLNSFYKPEWVKSYIKVEISVTFDGKSQRALSLDDTLSTEQIEIMRCADAGSDISVIVDYIPENNLSHNEAQQVDFTFSVEPETDAYYLGGQTALLQYIKMHAIDHIPDNTFEGYDLAAVQFTVTEEGHIENTHLFESSKNEAIDALLIDVICKMPQWQPAVYSDGSPAAQEYVCLLYTSPSPRD